MTSQGEPRPNDLLLEAAERASRYLEGLQERSVAPTQEALDGLKRLDEDLPLQPIDPHDVLALLDEVGSPATVATAGPRFFGFVIGGSLPATVAANWLASAWDQTAGLVAASPIGAVLEEVALRWLLELLGLPAAADVGFVTGATMANFTALAAARHALLAARGLGRRGRRALRRPADHGGRRRGGPPHPAQGPGLARPRAAARRDRPGRRPGADARRRAPASLGDRRSSASRPATSTRERSIP